MISFPNYVAILSDNYQEIYASNTIRSEFERGVQKQRNQSCADYKLVTFDAYVCDDKYKDFISWWKNDLKRGSLWFEFLDPMEVPAKIKKARMPNIDIKTNPQGQDFSYWNFSITLEVYDE